MFRATRWPPLVPLVRRELANLGYEAEHIWGKDSAAVVGRWRCKESRTWDEAIKAGSCIHELPLVSFSSLGGSPDLDPGQAIPSPVRAPSAEEGEPLFSQTLALFGSAWGNTRSKAKACLVRERQRANWLSSGWFDHVKLARDRERCLDVHGRPPLGQRTTNDHCGYGMA